MGINSTSLAAGVAVSVTNQKFKTGANVIPRKILIIGTHDPSLTDVVPDVPVQIFSPEHAGALTGFGFMIHRLAVQAFAGSNGVETWIIPQDEATVNVNAAGVISFTGPSTEAGTLNLYIAGLSVPVTVTSGMAATALATAVAAAINAKKELPVTAAVDGVNAYEVDITAKSGGPWGNGITIALNLGYGEVVPAGIAVTITPMATGAGIPDIGDALDALGTGDGANEAFFTDVIHGYGHDTTTLNTISAYVGAGNTAVGLYDGMVSRPFRSLVGDTVADSAGLTGVTNLGNARKTDRASGVIAVPGSMSHPDEIAAQAIGHLARVNSNIAEGHCLDVILIGIDPGDKADRWTSDYDNRDIAVKAGVSTTMVKSGVVKIQNLVTFYHPDDVPVSSNGFRSMRNISILQNIMANIRSNFEREKWQGITIVSDTNRVTNINSRKKARDVAAVIDDLAALAKAFEANAWLFSADYMLEKLAEPGAVSIRSGGTGFDNTVYLVLSGEGGILNNSVEFDTDISIMV